MHTDTSTARADAASGLLVKLRRLSGVLALVGRRSFSVMSHHIFAFLLLNLVFLAFGLVLMFLWYLFPRSKRFFRGESLNRETQVMVPDEPAVTIRSIDGGI